MVDIIIPSYRRPYDLKTVKYLVKLNWEPDKIHILIDSEADDIADYEKSTAELGCHLHIYDIEEARNKHDFVHRQNASRRNAGLAHNATHDIALKLGLDFYVYIDDDTSHYQSRPFGVYTHMATLEELVNVFDSIKEFMQRQRIGLFGLSQTGDMFERYTEKVLRKKVMNTTFVNTKYIYWGEKGTQDVDTSQFVGVMNAGLFTGSLSSGLVLHQMPSATSKGGNTEIYNELKLLGKALTVPIQYPSLCIAEKQVMNGNRIHHRINYNYLYPKIIKGARSNIAWDTYPEDIPFTNMPLNRQIKDKEYANAKEGENYE